MAQVIGDRYLVIGRVISHCSLFTLTFAAFRCPDRFDMHGNECFPLVLIRSNSERDVPGRGISCLRRPGTSRSEFERMSTRGKHSLPCMSKRSGQRNAANVRVNSEQCEITRPITNYRSPIT